MDGRFVLSIKNKSTGSEVSKARFVVQGHTDAEKNLLIHNGTNLKQSSIRLRVAVAALFGFRIWSQDGTQAYLQSAEALQREIYVQLTKEFRLSEEHLLKLLKPLYGLADAGNYCHVTMASHLRDDLRMVPTIFDLSLFFKRVKGRLAGLIGAYVDENIMAGVGLPVRGGNHQWCWAVKPASEDQWREPQRCQRERPEVHPPTMARA